MHPSDTPRRIIHENVVKNLLALLVAALLAPTVVAQLRLTLNEGNVGNFLVVLSMLLVTVCFANFAFSYQYLSAPYRSQLKALAHGTTFLFMFLMALLLIALTVAIHIAYPGLFLLTLWFNLLLYLAMVLYDFWDALRALNR